MRIKITQAMGYRGYFWHIESFYASREGAKPMWHPVGRGGYAMTFRGAKWAGKREIRKRQLFKSKDREWIIE